MTDPSQRLREAAERLRSVEENFRFSRTAPISSVYQPDPAEPSIADWHHDMHTIARAWLADNKADDGEEATPEWLMAVWFDETGYWTYERKLEKKPLIVRLYARPGGQWEASLFVGDHHVKDNATRGDVRRLAKCLGISLKEEGT